MPLEKVINLKKTMSSCNNSQFCISFLIFATMYSKLLAGHFHMGFMCEYLRFTHPNSTKPHLCQFCLICKQASAPGASISNKGSTVLSVGFADHSPQAKLSLCQNFMAIQPNEFIHILFMSAFVPQ